MVWVPGGSFLMGSEDFYPGERPVRRVEVDGFWINEHPVTVTEFRRFVKATGYVTVAERPLDPGQYPDADPALLCPGPLVFHQTARPVDLPPTWRPRTPTPTRPGRASSCPPRRSGSSLPAAVGTGGRLHLG